MQIRGNTKHRRLRCSGTNGLLISDFGTKRETQFLKVFRNHTILTTSFNGRNLTLCHNGRNWTIVFHGPTSKSKVPGRTPISQHHGRNTTVCLTGKTAQRPAFIVQRQPSKIFKCQPFQNLQILWTIASGHHSHSGWFPIWGLSWQLWLSYPLRTSVNCTQCLCTQTKSRIVQSPTKLNDRI